MMRLMVRRTCACLSAKAIPWVLCGSRFVPALLRAELAATDGELGSELTDVLRHRFAAASSSPQVGISSNRGQKRQVLDALVRWCGAHQQVLAQASSRSHVVYNPPSLESDEVALQWLQDSTGLLTCGQSLLVCSFLSEVLLCRIEAAALETKLDTDPEMPMPVRVLVQKFVNRIAALLQRVNASDKLESQPLSILTSCVYGVHRLSRSETPLLGEAERALLKTPAALIFAILHQLRGNALNKLFQSDERAAVGVSLSYLFIADEEHRQSFLSSGDAVLVNTILRLLVRHISPLIGKLEVTSQKDLLCLAHRSVPESKSLVETVNSPSMHECLVIMQNISFSSPAHRLDVLLYLLCIRRKPAQYTQEEVHLLPAVLQTVTNIRSREARSAKASIISNVPLPTNDPVLVAQLFGHAPVGGSRMLSYLESVVDHHLSPTEAAQVIRSAGVHLHWEVFRRLAEMVLGDTIDPTGSSSSSSSRVLPTDQVECLLLTLLARLSYCKGDAEQDAVRAYVSQLVSRIDWDAGTLLESPKMALQRLVLLTKISVNGFPLHVQHAVVALVEKTLDLESGSSMANTLRCVTEALALVPDDEMRRNILESMIRYSGTRSTSSAIRFLAFLAPLTTEHSALGSELVQQLLRLQTLNPSKLRHGSIEGVSKGIDTFSLFIIHAINFFLSSGEWRSSTEHLREAVSLWVHDYLHYVVDTAKERRSTAVAAAASKCDGGEVGSRHDEGEDASVVEGPSHEHLERVFVCMLRAGVKLPDFFASELSARVVQIEKDGARTDGTVCRMNFPPPGHFVFCCRLDVAMDSPLSSEFLEYLLTACDCRILYHVIAVFLTSSRAESQGVSVSLLANMQIASQSLELFLCRIEDLDDSGGQTFYPSTMSSVVANTLRLIVGYLTKRERNQRVLRSLNTSQEVSQRAGECGMDALLMVERTRLEKLIIRSIAHLSTVHMKNLGLLLLDRLALLSPSAADHLLLRLSDQLSEFTQLDLFHLARKYPQAQNLVVKELQKYDLALTVDLSEHVRVAGGLPMGINVMVIEAHLPKLTFQWCTRLLSTLSVKHELVPLPVLTRMLWKLEQESSGATPTDRNVALLVLQKYLKFEHLLAANDDDHGGDDDGGGVNEVDERRRLVEACCGRLLVLEGIDSLDALTDLLNTFPDALRSVAAASLIERVVQIVLPTVLAEIDALISMCRLLQKHKLLDSSVKLAIMEGFFLKRLGADTAGRKDDDTDTLLLNASVGVYPLGSVLSLVLLLSDDAAYSVASEDGDRHKNKNSSNVALRALQIVRERYLSMQDRFMIAGTLVDQKDGVGDAHMLVAVAEEICGELVNEIHKMTPSEFSRLLQSVSRLKCWHLVKLQGAKFDDVFRRACTQADAHTRCVAFKAVSPEPDLFRTLEPFMMPLLLEVVNVMSMEDVEMVLSAVLSLPLTESLESLIDSIGTRVLSMVDQCRRSTLIRMLQCHATFQLQDDMLVMRLLSALEEQCSREARLDVSQALTLLQAVVDLDVAIPPKLAVACFNWLEHHIEGMSITQLGHAARLAVGVEMGYTASVHTVAMRALEQRDAMRSNVAFRSSVELLCDEFSAEIPWNSKAAVVRRRLQTGRLNDYLNTRRQTQGAASAAASAAATQADSL